VTDIPQERALAPPAWTDIDKAAHASLLEEYKQLTATIIALVASTDRLLSIGVIVLGIGFSVGLKDNNLFVIAFVPVGLSLVFLYVASVWHNVHYLAGYKQEIEYELNDILNKNTFRWELICEKYVQNNVAMRWVVGIISVLYLATCAVSLSKIDLDSIYGKLYVASIALISTGMIYSYRSIYRSRRLGASEARRLLTLRPRK